MKNVLVIFGGKSVEHDISIITAMQALKNLPKGYNFIPVYIDKDEHWWLADNLDDAHTYIDFSKNVKNKRACTLTAGSSMLCEVKKGKFKKSTFIHCALLCCHGGSGEGGALQGLLKMCKIPFTSPDMQASVVCMDKVLAKLVMQNEDIKTPEFVTFSFLNFIENKDYFIEKCEQNLGYPMIVKPSRLGSSVGIHICANRQEFFDSLEIAKEYDDKIIVEKFISGCKEFCCACVQVNNKPFTSAVNEVDKSEMYTFEEKYLSDKNNNKKIVKALEEQIKKLTINVYQKLELAGLVRVDFLYNPKGQELYVCEINTIPGSLSFNLFENVKFSDLIANLIENAISKNEEQNSLIYSFNSDAIKHYITISKSNKLTK